MRATPSGAFGDNFRLVAIVVGLLALLGLWARLLGLGDSLWIDEFGTLWAVESDWPTLWRRVLDVQGQSPFYYTIAWAVVRIWGESAVALRMPSLVCGVATTVYVFLTAREIGGRSAGWLAASLAWVSFPLVEASVNARAYALAGLMAAVMTYGFVRATLGRRGGRLWFVAGGVGLFYAHYLLSVWAMGLAAAYVLQPQLRRRYAVRAFAADVVLQGILAFPAVLHLWSLWTRTGNLDWIRESRLAVIPALLLPLLLPALPTIRDVLGRGVGVISSQERAIWLMLACGITAPVAVDLAGVHLLAMRYLMPVALPTAIVGGVSLGRSTFHRSLLALTMFVVSTVALAATVYGANDRLTLRPRQDWDRVQTVMDAELERHPGAPVLYRSGFVEDDALEARPSMWLAPLRQPGKTAPQWWIVPLTWSWPVAEQEQYLDRRIAPILGEVPAFYLLSADSDTSYTGPYALNFIEWIRERYGDRYVVTPIDAGHGIQLVRFEASSPR